jgi:hypothetical protein
VRSASATAGSPCASISAAPACNPCATTRRPSSSRPASTSGRWWADSRHRAVDDPQPRSGSFRRCRLADDALGEHSPWQSHGTDERTPEAVYRCCTPERAN